MAVVCCSRPAEVMKFSEPGTSLRHFGTMQLWVEHLWLEVRDNHNQFHDCSCIVVIRTPTEVSQLVLARE